MNFISKITLSGLLLANGVAFAAEPAEGWYAGLMLGGSYAPATKVSIRTLPVRISEEISYNILGNFGGQIGFRCNKFRYEGELMYNRNTLNKITAGTYPLTLSENIKGNTSFTAGLFNAYYEFYDEFNSETKLVPYIGIGLGYGHISSSATLNYGDLQYKLSNTNNAPIGQGILGLNYFFSDTASVGTDVRYMSTNNIKNIDARVSVVTWNLVLNYTFDQVGY